MTNEEIDIVKYWVCCPMCDNKKCVKGTDKCEAEVWAKMKKETEEGGKMKAYKCDRCGKFFAHLARDVDKIFVTDSYKGDALANIKDLCAECQNELEVWWMMKEKEDSQKTCSWTDVELGRYVLLHRCSNCSHCSDTASNYCPNCGTKMEAENVR